MRHSPLYTHLSKDNSAELTRLFWKEVVPYAREHGRLSDTFITETLGDVLNLPPYDLSEDSALKPPWQQLAMVLSDATFEELKDEKLQIRDQIEAAAKEAKETAARDKASAKEKKKVDKEMAKAFAKEEKEEKKRQAKEQKEQEKALAKQLAGGRGRGRGRGGGGEEEESEVEEEQATKRNRRRQYHKCSPLQDHQELAQMNVSFHIAEQSSGSVGSVRIVLVISASIITLITA